MGVNFDDSIKAWIGMSMFRYVFPDYFVAPNGDTTTSLPELEPTTSPLGSIAREAADIVNGPRAKAYGNPLENWQRTVDIYNAITGAVMSPADGLLFMICVKLAREANAHSRDNLVDICGYADLLGYVTENEDA